MRGDWEGDQLQPFQTIEGNPFVCNLLSGLVVPNRGGIYVESAY